MLRSLVGSEMCMRDSINAEYGGALYQAAGGMQDAWLDKHTDLAHRIDELQVDAQEVARLSRAGKDTTRIQSQLSRDSAKLTTWLESLRRTLPNLPLSDQEAGRRSGMLIRTERAVAAIQSQANTRAGLFNGGNDLVADVETGNPQAEQLLLHQQQAIADQDASLDLLLASVNRQKQMGMAISDELDQQSSLLDELDDGMETTGTVSYTHLTLPTKRIV
eukprot:TRINITY_DN15397_c0_g1_i1.p1 TRINITY_DN15397_c0_g1~~TRINITY_DN15397_c0_g1_i1.p1  ORF type:complete len:219 (-),score=49.01 TRINITY_DN15397_c0_g1_i1:95-751(-)